MKTLQLTDKQAIQLRSILKYAYKTYSSKKDTLNDSTEQAMLELLALVKGQLK